MFPNNLRVLSSLRVTKVIRFSMTIKKLVGVGKLLLKFDCSTVVGVIIISRTDHFIIWT